MRKVGLPVPFIKYPLYICVLCIFFILVSCKRTDKNFSLDYIDKLTSIELSQNSLSVKLTKTDSRWAVNNSFEAGYEQIDILLYLINTQNIASQIPEDRTTSASAMLAKDGIRIKAYEEKNAVLDITVTSNDSLGYFGRSGSNKQLYQLSLPDIADDPFSFLSANSSYWKHNVIVSALPSEISTITVDNMENPESSFRITRETDGSLSLFGIYNRQEIANVNQTKLNTYLSYFNGLAYEQILDIEPAEQKAILLSDSPYILTIDTQNDEHIVLQLFYITENDDLDAYGNALRYDLNQFYLALNDGRDIALAKWVSFDLLLKDLSYFVEN